MSTTGIETWAVDLADVGPIYPFQGAETILVIVAVALWLGWHVVQLLGEKRAQEEKVRRHGERDSIERSLDARGD